MSDKLVWQEVEVDTLPKELAQKLKKLRDARAVVRNLGQEFDGEFVALLTRKAGNPPAGHKYVVGHNFGKLSFAVAESKTKSTSGKAKFRL